MSDYVIDSAACRRDLAELSLAIEHAAKEATHEAVEAGYRSAKTTSLFKDQSGDMRESIGEVNSGGGLGSLGPNEGAFFVTDKAARYVENGTSPHVIEARKAGALRFVVNGSVYFARRVNHPGTQARPFMAEAAAVAEYTLEAALEGLTDDAIRKH